jgi:dipeptidase E
MPTKNLRVPTIVAIGGGELRERETLPIDREIVRLTGKQCPRALFVPTASSDAEGYCDTFRAVYGGELGCTTDVLWLYERFDSPADAERRLAAADLVYVGGGNTLKMMRRWRRLGIDRMMIDAWRRGAVMSGVSAGAICWFRYGTSDSRRFYDPTDETLIRVRGLGLVDAVVSPHHVREPHRDAGLRGVMSRTAGVGLALDDNAALVLRGDRYSLLTSAPGVSVSKVFRHGSEVMVRRLDGDERSGTLAALLAR